MESAYLECIQRTLRAKHTPLIRGRQLAVLVACNADAWANAPDVAPGRIRPRRRGLHKLCRDTARTEQGHVLVPLLGGRVDRQRALATNLQVRGVLEQRIHLLGRGSLVSTTTGTGQWGPCHQQCKPMWSASCWAHVWIASTHRIGTMGVASTGSRRRHRTCSCVLRHNLGSLEAVDMAL